ncbi:hypothetical protein FO440_02720 [Mucilaginibacter corticis]|uniref:Uncharacterized protein n=1 Tax=Mucilaginibacter corticis TaxID=2597670 RepID=A0A556MT53_9SPHI|nr:hypothetical protein [Mucilaginibacter corticis]TSJ43120.1 hypothetical protein FO440_02720 [Mucilaginibacter corticis]
MAFDRVVYLKEKATFFVDEITGNNPIGLVGFKTKLKYFLSTLNNDLDKRQFIKYSLEILLGLTEEKQKQFKDFIYVLSGTDI